METFTPFGWMHLAAAEISVGGWLMLLAGLRPRVGTSGERSLRRVSGRSIPDNPTPLDLLGPWPLRILWMVLLVSALFAAMTLPGRRR